MRLLKASHRVTLENLEKKGDEGAVSICFGTKPCFSPNSFKVPLFGLKNLQNYNSFASDPLREVEDGRSRNNFA
jgi:hypothetical protein